MLLYLKSSKHAKQRLLASPDADLVHQSTAETSDDSEHIKLPMYILPDLMQVHHNLSRAADQFRSLSDFCDLPFLRSEGGRKYMVNLIPVWSWKNIHNKPQAEEFWKLAHAVARDQDEDDWLAPHMTLHSRSDDLNGLAEAYVKLVSEFGSQGWRELLSTLRQGSWVFDEDSGAQKPSSEDRYVLHKAKIHLPQSFRDWLDQHQDKNVLRPRKQDRRESEPRPDGTYEIKEMFHISLYSFRAVKSERNSFASSSSSVSKRPSKQNSFKADPRAGRHSVPTEDDLSRDLTSADWMLVLLSPGSTGEVAVIPQVKASVRLADLASGVLLR